MQPEPDAMLTLIADKMERHIIPLVDNFLKADLHMLALLVRAAAERFEVEADVFVREHEALEAIFRQARSIPALATATPAVEDEVAGFRLSDLRARAYRELVRLTILHAAVDDLTGCHPELETAIETFLAERVILHAFNASPYVTPGLAEKQRAIMLSGRVPSQA